MSKRDFVGIYKPKKESGGSVAQLKLGSNKDCVFLEMAKQNAPMNSSKPYDWANGIRIKLGHTDIGKILALLYGRLPEPKEGAADLELFHKNEKGNKIIKFKWQPGGLYLTASMKEGSKSEVISIPVSSDELELIRLALERAYVLMLGW